MPRSHTRSIENVQVCGTEVLTSGSDGLVCWDPRTQSPSAYASLPINPAVKSSPLIGVVSDRVSPQYIFASRANQIAILDRRALSEPIRVFTVNDDDITNLDIDDKSYFLAASDDTGDIKLIDLRQLYSQPALTSPINTTSVDVNKEATAFNESYTTHVIDSTILTQTDIETSTTGSLPLSKTPTLLQSGDPLNTGTLNTRSYLSPKDFSDVRPIDSSVLRGHENVCSGFKFRPQTNSKGFSGGFDCAIMSWDTTKRKILTKVDASAIPATDSAGSTSAAQSINPPFVYSLSCSNSGEEFAIGLGNGLVSIFTCLKEGTFHRIKFIIVK